jgi:hypothetical protein
MVAFPKGKLSERRKTTMQNEARDERVKAFEAELKELVRGLLEALMREERAMYLEHTPQAPTATTPATSLPSWGR